MRLVWLLVLCLSVASLSTGCLHSTRSRHQLKTSDSQPDLKTLFAYVDSFGPAALLSGLGQSNFSISTQFATAQSFFNQGINCLHGFWDWEALRAMRQVVLADPSSCMGWWGVFQSCGSWNPGLTAAGLEAYAVAQKLAASSPSPSCSQFERDWIAAWADPNPDVFVANLSAIVAKYPESLDAKLFLSVYLIFLTAGPRGHPAPERQLAMDLVLTTLNLTKNESAAANHYAIHAWEDTEQPMLVAPSLVALGLQSPNIPHMVHMPGHTYFLAGHLEAAHASFSAGYKLDHQYLRNQTSSVNHWQYSHNTAYMLLCAAEMGRINEAELLYKELLAGPVRDFARFGKLSPLDPSPAESFFSSILFYHALPSLPFVYMRQGWYGKAAHSLDHLLLQLGSSHNNTGVQLAVQYLHGLRAYAQGMAAVVERGDTVSGVRHLQSLMSITASLNCSEAQLDGRLPGRTLALNASIVELEAIVSALNGAEETAFLLLEQADVAVLALGYDEMPYYPRRPVESSAWLHITLARTSPHRVAHLTAARRDYQKVFTTSPKSGNALFGIGHVDALLGQDSAARVTFEAFLKEWHSADQNLEMVKFAKHYLSRRRHHH
eukprot:gnl/Hemi2/8720_TR3020_c0_g1_i1.p1 gnl/Hemi2/8720_TR3020_c0_g1~~gnl/Hemi2/8720_TR3020_c0_g1_i1.p1  ORF type:complete len:620 (-),score=222.29 gnl/Hemi2/8720_TR3020_c0_g1_i1:81-1895(-)